MAIQYRFSLTHDSLGTVGIEEPLGADDFKIRLSRDHNDVELIGLNALFSDLDLAFYGVGKQFIEDCITDSGNDTEITINVDCTEDEGSTWSQLTPGQLDLEAKTETDDPERGLVFLIPIVFSSFWQKFLQRIDTKVNIGSDLDLAGGTRETIEPHTIQMPTQTVRKEFRSILGDDDEHTESGVSILAIGSTFYFVPPFSSIIIEDIDAVNGAGGAFFESFTPTKALYTVEDSLATYNGATEVEHVIDVSKASNSLSFFGAGCALTINGGAVNIADVNFRMYYQINSDTPVQIGTNGGGSPADPEFYNTHTFSEEITGLQLKAGDEVRIFFRVDLTTAANTTKNFTFTFYFDDPLGPSGDVAGTQIRLYADTKQLLQLDRQCFKGHESAQKITNAICEQNGSFYSDFFGNPLTAGQTYHTSGCGSYSAIMKGKHLKGTFLSGNLVEDNPFDISFKEWFTGYNALHNLGVHEEEVDGVKRIRCEEKAYFFETGSPSITLSGVDKLSKRLASEFYFTDLDIGFDTWKHQKEFASIDDWATRHSYSTRFKNIGTKKSVKCNFIAASYALELTKREGLTEGRFDDNIFVVFLNRDGYEDLHEPEQDENFGSISNVLFPETAYNLRATPARMLLTWGPYLNIPFWEYSGEVFRFQGGEGNIDMESELLGDCPGAYENVNLHEDQNIPWNYFYGTLDEQQPLFKPIWWEFNYPLSFSDFLTILNNKTKSILVQDFDGTYKEVFPWDIEFNPRSPGETTFKCVEAYT